MLLGMNKIKNLIVAGLCSSACFALGYFYAQTNSHRVLVESGHAEFNQKTGDWQLKPFPSKSSELTEVFAPLFPVETISNR